ncbi:MAG: hypothetical protein D6732_00435 [Methanobacteriota archaeon]|nr:MAG: hypothetical protein D6732_00435 [Euryarchaeota archaeon]
MSINFYPIIEYFHEKDMIHATLEDINGETLLEIELMSEPLADYLDDMAKEQDFIKPLTLAIFGDDEVNPKLLTHLCNLLDRYALVCNKEHEEELGKIISKMKKAMMSDLKNSAEIIEGQAPDIRRILKNLDGAIMGSPELIFKGIAEFIDFEFKNDIRFPIGQDYLFTGLEALSDQELKTLWKHVLKPMVEKPDPILVSGMFANVRFELEHTFQGQAGEYFEGIGISE